MEPIIRLATSQDQDQVLQLLNQMWPDKPVDTAIMKQPYQTFMSDPHYFAVCAELEGQIVGFCSGYNMADFMYGGKISNITYMVVDSRLRGKKIGQKLITRVEELAREAGCRCIELCSASHRQGAHSFYQRLGFDIWGAAFSKHLD